MKKFFLLLSLIISAIILSFSITTVFADEWQELQPPWMYNRMQEPENSTLPEKSNTSNDKYPKIPVIMYHLISDNSEDWSDYCISSAKLEDDFTYIIENGFTPIFASEYKLLSEDKPIEKPILITFDDGYLSDLTKVMPIIERLQIKTNFFIIGKMLNAAPSNPNRYMNSADLRKLAKSKYAEIGSHSYSLHLTLPDQLMEFYINTDNIKKIINDFKLNERLIEKIIGKEIQALSFPYGLIPEPYEIFREKLPYDITFSSTEKLNSSLYDLHIFGRFNRPNSLTTTEFFDKILSKDTQAASSTLSRKELIERNRNIK